MALEIVWTSEAQTIYDKIIRYLEQNWSEKDVKNFVKRTNEVLKLVSLHPRIYRKSKKKNIHEAVITKHNTLYFKLKKGRVDLLTFWDNRQSPDKLEI